MAVEVSVIPRNPEPTPLMSNPAINVLIAPVFDISNAVWPE